MSRRERWTVAVAITALAVAIVVLQVLHLRAERVEDARTEALSSVREGLPGMFSYQHKTLERDLRRAGAMTTGEFRTEYRRLLDDVVLPTARRKSIDTVAEVTGAAVIDASPDEVRVLAFLTQSTSTRGTSPKIAASRVEVTLRRVDGHWLVSGLEPV